MPNHYRHISNSFENASRLFCDWSKTEAILLSPGSIPKFLGETTWEFESQDMTSKYLGVFMANQASLDIMKQHLFNKLQKRLDKVAKNLASLTSRVTLANHTKIIANHMIVVVL